MTDPQTPPPAATAAQAGTTPAVAGETRSDRMRRQSRRAWLYFLSILTIAALIYLVALVIDNTRAVKVSWVFGSGHASLVWLILVPTILGWVIGVATSILFRRRTRRPRI